MIRSSNLDETIPIVCNTGDNEIFANVKSAVSRDLPVLHVSDAREGVAVIVGGGPSLRSYLPYIDAHKARGDKVFTVNGTMRALYSAGIRSDYYVMLDARPVNLPFLDHIEADRFLIASQCAPAAFDILAGRDVMLWHPNYPGISEYIGDDDCALIGGGTTVGLQAISIAYAMGFREIHIYGFDSSFVGDEGHAYAQHQNDNDPRAEYWVAGKKYIAAPWMARQAMEFQEAARQLADGDAALYVHGDGLLPAIAKRMSAPLTVLTVYSPSATFTPEYVYRLKAGVEANLSIPHKFVCLTDHPVPGVDCLPLELGLSAYWAKPEIFRPTLPFGRTLFLDLSCVVTGSLDEIAAQEGIVITEDWYHGGPSQSVLLYDVGDFAETWSEFKQFPDHWMARGNAHVAPDFYDQVLMNHTKTPAMKYWQDVLPGQLVSYKIHGVPDGARLVKFHGRPKPHEVNWLQPEERQAVAV